MKHVLCAVATVWELKIIKEEIKKISPHNMRVSFLLLWIWNYKTILHLQEQLINKKYDFIINLGVCGYSEKYNKLIQISRIKNISNNKELIVPTFFRFSSLESIACSEVPVYSKNILNWENFVDMESYWLEIVCEKYSIPRIILKIPVDKIWEETKNFDFEKAKKFLSENIDYTKLIKNISKYLDQNNNVGVPLLEKYHQYYKMTFSEKLIFQKLYYKYSVLIEDNWWKKFDIFIEENKNFNKKWLFQLLENIE